MTLIQLTNPQQKSMETCISEAYESFGCVPLGGASGDGWSKMYDFQRCPYRYYLLHERKPDATVDSIIDGGKAVALELGSLWHACMAMHYIKGVETANKDYPGPYALLNRVASLGGNPDIIAECERLYVAYFQYYENWHNEGIKPLAIEYAAGRADIHTCRFDMIAKRDDGVWIYEHKTASRESRDVLEGWWLDGEILGEVYGYYLSNLAQHFGPLVGVCVNITFKTKEPKFRRVDVVITDKLLADYKRDIAFWRGFRQSMQDTGFWPRKLQGCRAYGGLCDFFDHCRDANGTDDQRLNMMLKASLED